jgi:hypothetical protein
MRTGELVEKVADVAPANQFVQAAIDRVFDRDGQFSMRLWFGSHYTYSIRIEAGAGTKP